MRTTLKRGMGRGAVPANGNGRAVFPPPVPTVMTRYRQPERPRCRGWRLVGRTLVWLAALLGMAAGGVAGGAYLWAHESTAAVAPQSREFKRASKKLDPLPPEAEKPTTALVIGSDRRVTERGMPARSDTIMLLRADPQADTVSMLSFPRDLVVPIQCPGWGPDRINQAYSACGPGGTLETVRSLTGLPIHYLIEVNFRAFRQIVDALGGVWVDVDRRYYNDNSDYGENYATIDLQPGYQQLWGWDALDFVRYRHTDSDLFRNARQQLFVRAAKERLSGLRIRTALRIVRAVTSNTQIGRAGHHGISPGIALRYARFAHALPAGHFFQPKIGNVYECGDEEANKLCTGQENIAAAVQEFANPDVEAPEKAGQSLGLKTRRPSRAPRPSRVSVVVLNGSGVEGAARETSYRLVERGYKTRKPPAGLEANAPRDDYGRSRIYFDPRKPRARAAAVAMAKLVGQADVGPIPLDVAVLSNRAMLVVVLGRTFGGIAPPPVEHVQRRTPPAVRTDPRATRALLRSVSRRVPFRLALPHLVEARSLPASDTPVRAYTIAPRHRAVRLTFATGAVGEYWGIQQTDWEDAPALAKPNFTRFIRGRRYDFYYSGPRLHMVVLRQGGVTYWVVNTLLDSLSNETMLAIAKGLKPLPRS